jgi:hypothetical protein
VALLSLPEQLLSKGPAAHQREFVAAAAHSDASQAIPSLLRAPFSITAVVVLCVT